jgi:hypothetical protein
LFWFSIVLSFSFVFVGFVLVQKIRKNTIEIEDL